MSASTVKRFSLFIPEDLAKRFKALAAYQGLDTSKLAEIIFTEAIANSGVFAQSSSDESISS
jgi:hypothetical protein